MSFFSFFSGSRRRNQATRSLASRTFRPSVETLEMRACPAVTAPVGLHLTAVSATQVQVTWNPVAGDLGYRIFEWNGTQTTQIGQVAAKTTTFTASQLTAFHQYYFTVQAFDATSIASAAWVSIITPRNPITAPTNVQAKATSGAQVTVSWNSSTGETGYNIFQWNGSTWVQVGATKPGVNFFNVSGLSAGLNYSFQVQAFNATNTANSAVVSATTLGTSVTAVTNLTAKALNANTIQLSWKNATGETGYNVYRWDPSSQTNQLVATLPATTTSYQDPNLLGSTTYWYYVQAFNAAQSVNSVWVSATTPVGLPLQAPTNVTAVAVNNFTAQLTWNLSAGAAGYRVYEWNGSTWVFVTTVAQGVNQVAINNLANGQTHWLLVQAFTANDGQDANADPVFVNL